MANRFSVTPLGGNVDFVGGLRGIGEAMQNREKMDMMQNQYNQQQQAQAQAQQKEMTVQGLMRVMQSGGAEGAKAADELSVVAPDILGQFHDAQQFTSDARTARSGKFYTTLLANDDKDSRLQIIDSEVAKMQEMGIDPTNLLAVRQDVAEDDPEANSGIAMMARAALDPKEMLSDYFKASSGADKSVQSAKILEDGTVIQVLRGTGTQVVSPSGEVITGEDARVAVRESSKQSHNRKIELKKLDQVIKTAQGQEGVLNDLQKTMQKSNIQRLSSLSSTSSGRKSAMNKAYKFKMALESGDVGSGASRSAAGFVPGVFTSQAQFDEEFNAFSEVAARQQLKASGELRPTDADVQGMKNAMFGIGRDEKVNIQLLGDFINNQVAQNAELDQLIDAGNTGNLSNFTFTPDGNDQAQANNQDQQALQWAQANPNDPRSAQILSKLGAQ